MGDAKMPGSPREIGKAILPTLAARRKLSVDETAARDKLLMYNGLNSYAPVAGQEGSSRPGIDRLISTESVGSLMSQHRSSVSESLSGGSPAPAAVAAYASRQGDEARKALQHYHLHGHFAAKAYRAGTDPQAVLQRFALRDNSSRVGILRALRIVKSVFSVPAVALVLGDLECRAVVASMGLSAQQAIYLESQDISICTSKDATVEHPESTGMLSAPGGITCFVKQPVEANLEGPDKPTLIGHLCLIDQGRQDQRFAPLSGADLSLLNDFGEQMGAEIEVALRRRTADRNECIRDDLSSLLIKTLSEPSDGAANAPAELRRTSTASASQADRQSTGLPGTVLSEPSQSDTLEETDMTLFDRAAESARRLLHADGVLILDAREFHISKHGATDFASQARSATSDVSAAPKSRGKQARKARATAALDGTSVGWLEDAPQEHEGPNDRPQYMLDANASARTRILGKFESLECDGWSQRLRNDDTSQLLSEVLLRYLQDSRVNFSWDELTVVLAKLLPARTQEALVMPFFNNDTQPQMILMAVKSAPWSPFDLASETIARAIGAICMSSLQRRQLHQAQNVQSSFISSISHELRIPISSIMMQIEAVQEAIAPNPDSDYVLSLLDLMHVASTSLRDILEDVLEFGQAGSKAAPAPTEVDLEELLISTVRSCAVRKAHFDSLVVSDANINTIVAEPTHVEIIAEIEQRSDWLAVIDATGLRRIILNLLSNSIKFVKSGSIRVTLQQYQGATDGPDCIQLIVADTGCGMSEEFVAKRSYFKPFKQENPLLEGAGLGLSLVLNLVRRMHGEIDLQSQLGVGTTVYVTLPLRFRHERQCEHRQIARAYSNSALAREPDRRKLHLGKEADRPSTPPKSASGTESSVDEQSESAGLRVMVAEDNVVSRNILVGLLKRKKVQYIAVDDGSRLVENYLTFRPHLIWTDIQMPTSGLEAAAQIRKLEQAYRLPRARIVAFSGSSKEDSSREGLLGTGELDDYFVKGSIKLVELSRSLDALQQAINSSQKQSPRPKTNRARMTC